MINSYIIPKYNTGFWSSSEIQSLVRAIRIYGTDSWRYIASNVGTRNELQWMKKWHSIQELENQPVTWSGKDEQYLFDLVFSNAYHMFGIVSDPRFSQAKKNVIAKIREMEEIWNTACFNIENKMNYQCENQMRESLFLNPKEFQSLNNKSLMINKQTNELINEDDDLKIIGYIEANSNCNINNELNKSKRKQKEIELQKSTSNMTKEKFIQEWQWTDGYSKWTDNENTKLLHLYQNAKDPWKEIKTVFRDKKHREIRRHFYSMLHLLANEYQKLMTHSFLNFQSSDQKIDKWILNYTDGVKEDLYISDINKVSEEKLLWFLPILINIFKGETNKPIWTVNKSNELFDDETEFSPLEYYEENKIPLELDNDNDAQNQRWATCSSKIYSTYQGKDKSSADLSGNEEIKDKCHEWSYMEGIDEELVDRIMREAAELDESSEESNYNNGANEETQNDNNPENHYSLNKPNDQSLSHDQEIKNSVSNPQTEQWNQKPSNIGQKDQLDINIEYMFNLAKKAYDAKMQKQLNNKSKNARCITNENNKSNKKIKIVQVDDNKDDSSNNEKNSKINNSIQKLSIFKSSNLSMPKESTHNNEILDNSKRKLIIKTISNKANEKIVLDNLNKWNQNMQIIASK